MVAKAHPAAAVEVWAQDEARFGLIPSTRRIWARKGRRPLSCSRRRYEWGYLYGFVHPHTGRGEWVVGTTVNVEAMNQVLQEFAKAVGAGPKKRVIIVWDGAGWHTSDRLEVPEGIHLAQLPSYSPELQPAECVWPLINEAVANRDFTDLDELIDTVGNRCLYLSANPELIQGRTQFWWWPDDVEGVE